MAAIIRRGAPAFKEGDIVLTPRRRMARIVGDPGRHGERELQYLDLEGGEVTLHRDHLTLVTEAPPKRWKGPRTP